MIRYAFVHVDMHILTVKIGLWRLMWYRVWTQECYEFCFVWLCLWDFQQWQTNESTCINWAKAWYSCVNVSEIDRLEAYASPRLPWISPYLPSPSVTTSLREENFRVPRWGGEKQGQWWQGPVGAVRSLAILCGANRESSFSFYNTFKFIYFTERFSNSGE